MARRYAGVMNRRSDLITASRVDLCLILLPELTWLERTRMFAINQVPADVAARVITLPLERRAMREEKLEAVLLRYLQPGAEANRGKPSRRA